MVKKAAAKKKEKSFEETLWDAANKLRGSVESSEYKLVLSSSGHSMSYKRGQLIIQCTE